MTEFTYHWINDGDARILYSRPLGSADEQSWADHYEELLAEFGREQGLFIVDVQGVYDDFGIDGIKKDLELLRKYGFKSARFALITDNRQDAMLVKLFNDLATIQGMDAQVKIFSEFEPAKAWLINSHMTYREHGQVGSE